MSENLVSVPNIDPYIDSWRRRVQEALTHSKISQAYTQTYDGVNHWADLCEVGELLDHIELQKKRIQYLEGTFKLI